MNAFIPQNPKVIIYVPFATAKVGAVINNIDPDLEVVLVTDPLKLDEAAAGVPYDSRTPRTTPQVLAHGKH